MTDFLVACVLVVVGAFAEASASSTATGTWTLNVTFAGTGTGLVTTSPAGIVLRDVGCKVGTVRYAYPSSNINFGEFTSQNPKPHWQRLDGAVDLVVSKGRRGP